MRGAVILGVLFASGVVTWVAGACSTFGSDNSPAADAAPDIVAVDASDGGGACTGAPVYVDDPSQTADNHCGGGAVADLASDATNCGACGHSCGASVCSAGMCAPTKLLPDAKVVAAYVVAGTVYYVGTSRAIFTARIGDVNGTAYPGVLLPDGTVRRLQADDTWLYVSMTSNQSRIRLANGLSESLPVGSSTKDLSGVVALTNDAYYYASQQGVEQHPKNDPTAVVSTAGAVTDVVADATQAFWVTKAASGATLHGPFPSVTPSLGTPASAAALALDKDFLYFADTSAQQIRRAPRVAGNTQAVAKESSATIGSLAVDGDYIYWTADHGSVDGWALMRVPKCGGVALTLAKGLAQLTQLSFDDKYVYTANVSSLTAGSLISVAK